MEELVGVGILESCGWGELVVGANLVGLMKSNVLLFANSQTDDNNLLGHKTALFANLRVCESARPKTRKLADSQTRS